MGDDCLVCREHRLEVPLPGGHLVSTDEVVAFHLPPWPPAPDVYLGHLAIPWHQVSEWGHAPRGDFDAATAVSAQLRAVLASYTGRS